MKGVFSCVLQATGQDQCRTLQMQLEKRGYSVWYDMTATDLTSEGMEEGVSQSRNVIIFLSDGIMSRPFCLAEQRWALHYGCNLIGLMETDRRHHPAVIEKEKQQAPADLRRLFTEVDFDVYQRKEHLAKAMLDHVIEKRIHTVIKAGFLEKKGGDLEIHETPAAAGGVGDPPQYHAVKHRNISKGNSRAWRKRWFVLFDDGILQWYASGPPAAAEEEDSSAFARSSVRRNNLSSVFLSFGPSL